MKIQKMNDSLLGKLNHILALRNLPVNSTKLLFKQIFTEHYYIVTVVRMNALGTKGCHFI